MTNLITLTIPNDDHVALRAFGKALEEMALAHGAESHATLTHVDIIAQQAGIDPAIADAYVQGCHDTEARLVETDSTAQQVESLATNVVQREVEFDNPPPETSDATTDSTDTPWDERIHSASKALNADGTWRLRRKPKDMDEAEWAEYVVEVKGVIQNEDQTTREHDEQVLELEYPSTVYAPIEPPVTLEDVVDTSIERIHTGIAQEFSTGIANAMFTGDRITPPGDDFHMDTVVVTEQTVAGIPPIPVPPPVVVPPVPVADEQAWDFPKLMMFLTERHDKIDVPTVNQLLAVDGLAALTDLNAHPDKIGPFVARVKAHLGE